MLVTRDSAELILLYMRRLNARVSDILEDVIVPVDFGVDIVPTIFEAAEDQSTDE
jgi:hypothetical protein